MGMVPSDLLALINSERPVGLDLTHLKTVLTGGSAISGDSVRRVRREFLGTITVVALGLTESCCAGLVIRYKDPHDLNIALTKPASIGLPVLGCQIKVINKSQNCILN